MKNDVRGKAGVSRAIVAGTAALALAGPAPAQDGEGLAALPPAAQLVVPQSGAFALQGGVEPVRVEAVTARAIVQGHAARTSVEISLRNPAGRDAEAVLLLPVPPDAAVHGFVFEGAAAEPTAKLLARAEARRLYDDIVRELRDPALLEFAGHDLVRSSVFPVAAGGTQRLLLTYEHLLGGDAGRIDYVLPRSESLAQEARWQAVVELRSERRVATVYSPTHDVDVERHGDRHVGVSLGKDAGATPGPLVVSALLERAEGVTATVFTHPDPAGGGGWFLMLAGLPPPTAAERGRGLRREVTLVLDRSGSMAGDKLAQAKAAAVQVLESLEEGEDFAVVDYGTTVSRPAPGAVSKTPATLAAARDYLARLRPGGGTNVHDALLEALLPAPKPDTLPIVLFLTDGVPTIGRTSESAIRALAERGNAHGRRVFTFGVGHDVNVPLLDRIAEVTRAKSTYVLPRQDIDARVGMVFDALRGPVFSDVRLVADGDPARVTDVHPATLPDLFEHDRLVVLGRYRGQQPLRVSLEGRWLGRPRTFELELDPAAATARNAFVPRLWATRRIADLADRVRQAGAGAAAAPRAAAEDPPAHPARRGVLDEIVRLSAEFGVLCEYTAFLADEGTRLSDWEAMVRGCGRELDAKAVQQRWGRPAVAQGVNLLARKNQLRLDPRNTWLDETMQRVQVTDVQQLRDRAFFKRGARWIDGRAVRAGDVEPHRAVPFGSDEHLELVWRLVREGRSACASLKGEILLRLGQENVLIVDDDC